MAERPQGTLVYDVLDRWRRDCLREGRSLAASRDLWVPDNFARLREAFNEQPDTSSASFLDKLGRQFAITSDDVVHLFAEVFYIHLLPTGDISGETKRRNLAEVADMASGGWELDDQLDAALDQGVGNAGVAYRSYRPQQLWLLVDTFEQLLGSDRRADLLDDPWAFKEFVHSIEQQAAYSQRNLLLHMVHPATFDGIASREHKQQIAGAFAQDGDPDDVDRALVLVRSRLEAELGDEVDLYAPRVRRRWDPQLRPTWDALAHYAAIVQEWQGFDTAERDYKLQFANAADLSGDVSVEDVERAIEQLRKVNLVDFRVTDDFQSWATEHPSSAVDAVQALLEEGAGASERVDGFAAGVAAAVDTTGAVCSLASALLLASGPTTWPPYRTRAVATVRDALKAAGPDGDVSHGQEYEAWLELVDAAREQLLVRGIEVRDRLDVQSLLWVTVTGALDEEPFAALPDEERAALASWRGGAVLTEIDPTERERRGRRLDSLTAQLRASGEKPKLADDQQAAASAAATNDALAELEETGDLEVFAKWLRTSGDVLEHTQQGAHVTYLGGLVKHTTDPELTARLVHRAFTVTEGTGPDWDAAVELEQHARETGTANGPAAGMTVLAASCVWALQDRTWPPYLASAEKALERLGWVEASGSYVDRYQRMRRQLDLGDESVWWTAAACSALWSGSFLGLDPTLVERCTENGAWLEERATAAVDLAVRNASQVVGELIFLGKSLRSALAASLRHDVTVHTSGITTPDRNFGRADGFVVWQLGGSDAPELRVMVTGDGVAVGLAPHVEPEATVTAATLAADLGTGLELLEIVAATDAPMAVVPRESGDVQRAFLVGRWFPGEDALGRRDLREDILAVAEQARPILTAWITEFGGTMLPLPEDDPLADAVEAFQQERGYPSASDRTAETRRREFAERLTPTALETFQPDQLRDVLNSHAYGYTGAQSTLNVTLRDADEAELSVIGSSVAELLHGDGPIQDRIDAILDPDRDKVRGLGESGVWKLLAVVHPDRCLPVFPYDGDMGKQAFLELLDLSAPDQDTSAGGRHVTANEALRDRLAPFFGDDTHGMREFLYWWRSWDEREAEDVDHLAAAADDLHVSRAFIDELVDLLHDKRQVIFYGPPGTGKTYLARRLAQALVAEDDSRHELVQFHPSYTYEDFFEGYRPKVDDAGRMTYQLQSGPLARLVERAAAAPGADHVLVIDEINRANLAKVFGELLYLLEYRGPEHTIATQYRPDGGFTLPKRLLVLGTMNTADRSIALIDAAMRRRFHFVPFFPNEGEIGGLLRRWLSDHHPDEVWVADLLDLVNDDLREDLGGPHLQIGPSHFMVDELSRERLRRIWDYSVHPYIEEQLFGQDERIASYEFDEVLRRHHAAMAPPGDAEEVEPGDGHGPDDSGA